MKKKWQKDILILCGIGAAYLLAKKYKKVAMLTTIASRFLLSRYADKKENESDVSHEEAIAVNPVWSKSHPELHQEPEIVH